MPPQQLVTPRHPSHNVERAAPPVYVAVRTDRLAGAALGWAVALAEGRAPILLSPTYGLPWRVGVMEQGRLIAWRPERDPVQGHPLIDRHGVETMLNLSTGRREASTETLANWYAGADTLQAVCRAVVASVLGDEVRLPVELVA